MLKFCTAWFYFQPITEQTFKPILTPIFYIPKWQNAQEIVSLSEKAESSSVESCVSVLAKLFIISKVGPKRGNQAQDVNCLITLKISRLFILGRSPKWYLFTQSLKINAYWSKILHRVEDTCISQLFTDILSSFLTRKQEYYGLFKACREIILDVNSRGRLRTD